MPDDGQFGRVSLLQSLRDEPSLRRPAVLLAALVVAVPTGEYALSAVVDGVVAGSSGFPLWLPTFGTVGETMTVYALLLNLLEFATVAAVAWLAYEYGRHSATDPGSDTRR